MCKLTTLVDVELSQNDLIHAIEKMRKEGELDRVDERTNFIAALSPTRDDILELLSLDHEKDNTRHCMPYWTDEEKIRILQLLFNPRGILNRGQIASDIIDLLMRLW